MILLNLPDDISGNIDLLSDSAILIDKANLSSGVETTVLTTSENTAWTSTTSYDFRMYAIWYNMIAAKIFNTIKVPLRKNVAGTDFIGGITVRIAINDVWLYSKSITLAELVAWGLNAQTTGTSTESTMYEISIPLTGVEIGDEIYVVWS